MGTHREKLTSLLEVILAEAHRNPAFAESLERALRDRGEVAGEGRSGAATGSESERKANRRSKAVLDPFELFTAGEPRLREALAGLNLEQLKDVVAEYGMDRSRLALKWKSADRLIALIVDTVNTRARKGTAFLPELPEVPNPES